MGCNLCVASEYLPVLQQRGWTSVAAVLDSPAGEQVSSRARGSVYCLELSEGDVVYVKTCRRRGGQWLKALKYALRDWLCLSRAENPLFSEAKRLRELAEIGIRVPGIVASGQACHLGVPADGVLIMQPLSGVCIDEALSACDDPERRLHMLRTVGRTVGRYLQTGYYWPHLRAKHVYMDASGTAGLLDVESMVHRPRRAQARRKRVLDRLWRDLEQAGVSDTEWQALEDATRETKDVTAERGD